MGVDGAEDVDSLRVLLVEAQKFFREGLHRLLEEEPAIEVITEADNAEDAMRIVATEAPDVVVMAIELPGDSGISATQEIRARSPVTQVLILTEYEDDEHIAEAILAGASGYVLKDSPVEEIREGIAVVARGEAKLSSRVAMRLMGSMRGNGSLTAAADDEGPHLTKRETEVLRLIATGKDNSAIAAELFISPQTVKNHVSNVLAKLQVRNRIEAALYAVRRGII